MASVLDGYKPKIPHSADLKSASESYNAEARAYFDSPSRKVVYQYLERSISTGASITDCYFLHRYIQAKKPERALELGCGVTSCIQAHAFRVVKEESATNPVGHLDSMEHLEIYFEDAGKLAHETERPYVTFSLSPSKKKCWRTLNGLCYDQLPEGEFEMLFVDGPPAELWPTLDVFFLLEKNRRPIDIIIDRRTVTCSALDRFLPPDTLFFDYANDLGFACGVTADMLRRTPRIGRPLKHRDIFKTFGLA